jgi:hypothetical protein
VFDFTHVGDAYGKFEHNRKCLQCLTLNNVTAKKGSDGSITIQFGGCDGTIPNCLLLVTADLIRQRRVHRDDPTLLAQFDCQKAAYCLIIGYGGGRLFTVRSSISISCAALVAPRSGLGL